MPNTDLKPMPFSPISTFSSEIFFAASAMPVMANTLAGVKPNSLYVNTILAVSSLLLSKKTSKLQSLISS